MAPRNHPRFRSRCVSGRRWVAWCFVDFPVRRGAAFSSASAMRVCQPGPLAFQRAMTCGGTRNDSSCRGLASFGRPRRTSLSPWYKSAVAIQSSVISGGSASREMGAEFLRFVFMTVPHADDASCNAARRPCEYDQAAVQPAGRDVARLAVVTPIVCTREVWTREYFGRAPHVEATFPQCPLPLGLIAGDAHVLFVATKTARVKGARS